MARLEAVHARGEQVGDDRWYCQCGVPSKGPTDTCPACTDNEPDECAIEPPAKPLLVQMATQLRAAFQSGNDDAMLDIWYTGDMRGELDEALANMSDRTMTYAAPQIASLAERVAYVEQQQGR